MVFNLSPLWKLVDLCRFKPTNKRARATVYADEVTNHNGIIGYDDCETGRMWNAAAPGPVRRPKRNKNRQRQAKKNRAQNRA